VSRIQDILARAERDGTAHRTHAESAGSAGATTAALVTPINDTVTLGRSPFTTDPEPVRMTIPVTEPAIVARPVTLEPRTARATLHPALVVAIAPHSSVAERYRTIRTRLTLREEAGPLRSILVTSPGAGDGKSVTCANLALTMAQEFQRTVVLVDADLRTPSVHTLFGIERGPGLGDVLAGDATLDEALVHLPDYGLTILPAGRAPHFPTELLGSGTMRRTFDTLRARFDRVLLDLPPVAPLADVSTVAPLADGAVMVVRAGATQRPALDRALDVFEDGKVIGVVLNEAH